MTKLREIFEKPVDRAIEGVIKADDDKSLRIEVEEYVLTNEVSRQIEKFLEAYRSSTTKNGVWISGFFGSGKSHLLKMLSLLLENRPVDGLDVMETFLQKCGENHILAGEIRQAVAIPSRSILFNIDQKADVINKKEDVDALLGVFVKVFDEACGYYGKHGYIADFERDLDRQGLLQQYKENYMNVAGAPWEEGRETVLLAGDHVSQAYSATTNSSEDAAKGIMDRYREDHKLSIVDFANRVKNYIDQQEAGFRLNFFVDEVGQYIADNTKLMTNLQTIAESLATICEGRSWIVVTAQEDMDTVLGENSKQQSHDFTKIQARFANRLKLGSADVAEVIEKRLLLKTDEAEAELGELFDAQNANFPTLFGLGHTGRKYRDYVDKPDFVNKYPFIPYQFGLFQAAIRSLSEHNAFEGRHTAVGERSMLAVFQDVARQLEDKQLGDLATFDLMYAGIQQTIKTQVRQAIDVASKNLEDDFALRVLKVLFLVKYVKEFKATPRNLVVLMYSRFGEDIKQLQSRIMEALENLEQQVYIQRSGEEYEFLTNEEKDVEHEIKNLSVDDTEVGKELSELIFSEIIKDRKIRYEPVGESYTFGKKLDNISYGKDSELTIHIASPLHPHFEEQQAIITASAPNNELLVLMDADDQLVRSLIRFKKTDLYLRQHYTSTQSENVKRILDDKRNRNTELRKEINEQVRNLLADARMYVSGSEVPIKGNDPASRIQFGFQELVRQVYPNLKMLPSGWNESEYANQLKQVHDKLFAAQAGNMLEPEIEVLNYIAGKHALGIKATLKNITDHFERKPYGWWLGGIVCTVASLWARQKITAGAEGNELSEQELLAKLKNTQQHGSLKFSPKEEYKAEHVRQLQHFFRDYFDHEPGSAEPQTLYKETLAEFKQLIQNLKGILVHIEQFPFLSTLTEPVGKLEDLAAKPESYYFSTLQSRFTELLDQKRELLDKALAFMNGPQRSIYRDTVEFQRDNRDNLSLLSGQDASRMQEILSDPDCFRNGSMQELKQLKDRLSKACEELLESERAVARKRIDATRELVMQMPEVGKLPHEPQVELLQLFENMSKELDSVRLVAVLRDKVWRFTNDVVNSHLKKLLAAAAPAGAAPVEFVWIRELKPDFKQGLLASDDDVDSYIESLRAALKAEIKAGRRIQL
ncbi:BREX system P-loop protein BrxC [bacterium]|nr:BREX system P-loop protein BrxC [bacterium]